MGELKLSEGCGGLKRTSCLSYSVAVRCYLKMPLTICSAASRAMDGTTWE
jgi:hypothetical protein